MDRICSSKCLQSDFAGNFSALWKSRPGCRWCHHCQAELANASNCRNLWCNRMNSCRWVWKLSVGGFCFFFINHRWLSQGSSPNQVIEESDLVWLRWNKKLFRRLCTKRVFRDIQKQLHPTYPALGAHKSFLWISMNSAFYSQHPEQDPRPRQSCPLWPNIVPLGWRELHCRLSTKGMETCVLPCGVNIDRVEM